MSEPAIDKVNGASGINHANGQSGQHVIDLRETPASAPTTRVRVSRDSNPFAALSPAERMKLIIRVLCEIVAYGEIDEPPVNQPDQPDHPAVTG